MDSYEPTSGLGWIDFSDTDKQKVMKVLELIKADGTVDELGVGIVRNSLSDAMFNGVTTIMTRAKYYFIIPRILHSYLKLKKKKGSAKEYLRTQENEIMNELTRKYIDLGSLSKERIIGYTIGLDNLNRRKRHYKEVERKPSTIYWNGIRNYGIYKGQQSLTNFLLSIENKNEGNISAGYLVKDGDTGDDRDSNHEGYFPFLLPDYDKDWRNNLTIDLTTEEGSFLRGQIIDTQKGMLLAAVLSNEEWMQEFLKPTNFYDLCDLPFVAKLPATIQTILYTARDFWQIMYGAHIRYNIILHSRHGSELFLEECIGKWVAYVEKMKSFKWENFNRPILWQITESHSKIKPRSKRFINNWMDAMLNGNFDTTILDGWVEKQEFDNKGSLSKLKPNNDDKYKGWIGINRMEYRFDNVKVIVDDIAQSIGTKNA